MHIIRQSSSSKTELYINRNYWNWLHCWIVFCFGISTIYHESHASCFPHCNMASRNFIWENIKIKHCKLSTVFQSITHYYSLSAVCQYEPIVVAWTSDWNEMWRNRSTLPLLQTLWCELYSFGDHETRQSLADTLASRIHTHKHTKSDNRKQQKNVQRDNSNRRCDPIEISFLKKHNSTLLPPPPFVFRYWYGNVSFFCSVFLSLLWCVCWFLPVLVVSFACMYHRYWSVRNVCSLIWNIFVFCKWIRWRIRKAGSTHTRMGWACDDDGMKLVLLWR